MVHIAEQKVLFFAHFYAFRSDEFLGLRRIWEDKIGLKHSKWHVVWCTVKVKNWS